MKADAKLENARTGSATWREQWDRSYFSTIYYLDLCLSLRGNLPHWHIQRKIYSSYCIKTIKRPYATLRKKKKTYDTVLFKNSPHYILSILIPKKENKM